MEDLIEMFEELAAGGTAAVFSGTVLLMTLLILAVPVLLSLAIFLINGWSLMKIAKKLGIGNGWLGFIPVANNYLYGKFAEKSDEAFGTEKKRSWGKILLWCSIGTFAISAVSSVFSLIPYIGFIITMVLFPITLALSVFTSVIAYIVYYKLFKLMAGNNNAVWMLVLSILVPIAFNVLIIVFAFGKKYPVTPLSNEPFECAATEVPTEVKAETETKAEVETDANTEA